MIGLILRIVAFLLFVLAGVNQVLFSQPPADEVAFGLAAWVLAGLLDGVGPAAPVYGRTE
jgi:hypothetical protein